MNLQNRLDNMRVMLDTLRSNLASLESASLLKKEPSDEYRKTQLKENIIRAQQEIYDLERQIIASKRK